VSVCDINI